MEYYNKYIINIFERYTDLKQSKKEDFDNNDLWKIFEYYSCIKLSEEYKNTFYEYDDIDPNFKELNKMSRNDTGIDCSDLLNTIVQCKLRKNTLNWKECSTFFGSQVIFSNELKKPIVRWENLIITRNNDCTLSENLLERNELFIDKQYDKNELISFCENLMINPPEYPIMNEDFKLRDYQMETINIIKNNNKNIAINLPTGTGKNAVIIYSMKNNLKYLILVPRIILMEQLKKEIIKHNSKLENKIQLIGDGSNIFDENKLITICVFNSVHLIENQCINFEKIFIDEAHHINKPEIYYENYEDDELEEYFSDDSEDELINVKNYTKIIKSLVKYNNNVYLSATIDSIDDFEYYNKDIRTMIELKYLCDYQIHLPIFNDDITNKNICSHLLKNYRNIIIYCNSHKEGEKINKLMNELQLNSSDYIDCNTSKKKRDIIIEKYKNGEIPFLVNVRILVEGFDAPITKGVCFLHLPTNKTTLIQIIGRCLRLHPTKTIANIILPFSSKEDEKNICNFLKVIAKNDSRIKKSFENKKLGGYISIENVEEIDEDDIEFKYNMIYDSMGTLLNRNEIWMKKLEKVEDYILKNNKRPSSTDKDIEIKQLGKWIENQKKFYSNDKYIMKDETIKKYWENFIEKYKEYFLSNTESWFYSLGQVEDYILKNNKRPSSTENDIRVKQLGKWMSKQKIKYSKYEYIMKDEYIRKTWEDFLEKYKEYFLSTNEIWFNILKQVEDYIIKNNKRPSHHDKDIEIKKLFYWIYTQKTNYLKDKDIMKDKSIKKHWEKFVEKYKEYFLSNNEMWFYTLKHVEEYIIKNNKIPSQYDKDIEIKKIGQWINQQKIKYCKNEQIMKDEIIKKAWFDFIEKHKQYFLSNNEIWFHSLKQVEDYIIKNNKRPSTIDKDIKIKKLGNWIYYQKKSYSKNKNIMKDETIKKQWIEFILKYKEYF